MNAKLNLRVMPKRNPVPPAREQSVDEVCNRFWKAARFAAAMHACGITSDKAKTFIDSQWRMLRDGLKEDEVPGDETRPVIYALLMLLESSKKELGYIAEIA